MPNSTDTLDQKLLAERRVQVGEHSLNVAEGPDNGPAVVLLHGQGSRWQDHQRVLPTLVEGHHVFAIDVPGHGSSAALPASSYTLSNVGELLAQTIEQVVTEPAIVSGHSSGGLVALGIAANRPDLVRGLLLEDPPLFSSVLPRGDKTTGGTLHRLAAAYLRERPEVSFQRYYVAHSNYFAFFGPFARPLTNYSLRWIDRHPDRPLRIWFLPGLITVFFEGLIHYDPAFGAAWDTDQWYGGFDTAAALAAVSAPTVLIHTTWWHDHRGGTSYDKSGVLMAAMDTDDATRSIDLLPEAELITVSSGHLVHFERPKGYLAAFRRLADRVATDR
ncbi:alpha/beta hydrolase [Kribbella sp. NPDC050124]|uniref:alpha/beta hydrolase n=1 Tax=Kribbella sp. NPDC050124 TaxID=3364114 RepID=UPI00378E92D8